MSGSAHPTVALITCLHYPGDRLADTIARLGETAAYVSEIIVVLDGVTVSERQTVTWWASLLPNVHLIAPAAPLGVARARNLALTAVTSTHVWFVDDDDHWVPDAPRILADSLAQGYDVIAFRARYRDHPGSEGRIVDGLDQSRVVSGADARRMLLGGQLHGFLWSKIFSRRVLGDDPFPDLSSQSDVVGVARALARSRRVRLRPEELYTYINRPGSITRHSAQRLANLHRASELVIHALADDADADHIAEFRAWFLCAGTVRTVARQRMRMRDALPALREARHAARALGRGAASDLGDRLALELAALRISPRLAVALGRVAYRTLDARRALRRARS